MKENSRTLYRQYKLEKKNLGGFFGRDGQGNFNNLDKMNRIGSFATGMIGALDPGDENGVQSDIGAGASGAISGAMALAPLGPVGLGVGAVLGGVTSLFGNQKKKDEAEQRQMARNERLADQKADEVQKQIALDPSRLGRNDVSMYKMGGTIMGKPAGKFALQGTLIGKYRAQQSLMPNISVRPNRMMAEGGNIGGEEELGDEERKWMSDYIKSPKYAERINRGGYKDGYWEERKNRLRSLNTVGITQINSKKVPVAAFLHPIFHEIVINKAKANSSTLLHELSHASGALPPIFKTTLSRPALSPTDMEELEKRSTKDFQQPPRRLKHAKKDGVFVPPSEIKGESKESYKKRYDQNSEEFELDSENNNLDWERASNKQSKNSSYYNNPAELKATLDESRYLLQKKGLFDSRKKNITPKELENILLKLKNDNSSESNQIRSAISRFKSNEDYIWVLNNIASISKKEDSNYQKAEYGGLIKMANGGKINIDSSGRGIVKGPSHKNGGVKIPELGVELEGDETLDGDFVFSKKLGFAAQHKKLMKGIKGTQKDNTPLSIYTRKKLEEKEEMLKVKQEETKKSLGLPNEIDGQQTEEFAIGGSLPKKIYADYLGIPSGVTANTKVTIPTPPNSLSVNGDSSYTVPNTTSTGKSTFDKIGDGLEKVTPFISNIANTFRKLPAVPDPILDDAITPLYQDYSASRAEVARGVRGANKVAEQQLASSSATNATRAANLVSGFRATNEINQAQNNANVGIANQTISQNAEIKRNNNTKLEYKASQDVARSLKQQELNSENLANFTDKLQLQTRDNNLRSLEDDKLMLQIAQDNTGASWRAGRDIFKRRLTPESFQALDEKMSNLEKLSKEERELTIKALQNGLSSLGNSPALNRSPLVEYKKKK